MKTKLLISLFAMLMATVAWADVEINERNFPDEGCPSRIATEGTYYTITYRERI